MVDFKYHYTKPKSLLRELIQKLFLKILKKMFSNKFWTYKNKIKHLMNRGGYFFRFYLACSYLRIRYPFYIRLPSKQLYAIALAIKFLKILKPQKIDFFLIAGSLLGAVRQESFAGGPQDVDLGIKEEQLPKLLNAIPILIKNGARFVRKYPNKKPKRVQIMFPCMLVDIGICRKKKLVKKVNGVNEYIEDCEDRSNRKIKFSFPLGNLITIKAYGRKFFAPSKPEVYLKKLYGKNWRIPNKKQFSWNNKFKQ